MENAVKLKSLPHCVIFFFFLILKNNNFYFFYNHINFLKYNFKQIVECVIIPRSFASKAELYFRKELNELGGDWSVHK